MTLVYLLRHGATASNQAVPYRLQGQATDLPLGPVGLEQAHRASEALAGRRLVAVYTSPLLRAAETARAIAQPHGIDPVAVPDLIEADIGRWEGLTWDEARLEDADHYDRFHAHPGTVPYPSGESFLDVQRRVDSAISRLAAAHADSRIAVVGHNVANRAYLAPLLGLRMDDARSLRQANGGISVIRYESDRVEVVTLNACLHLPDGLP